MILYFADRRLNIIGQASTKLPKGLKIVYDLKSEDVDTGVSSFECTLSFSNLKKEERKKVTTAAAVGNYILKQSDDGNKADEFYTIIEYEENTKDQTVSVYAEDAGLDLLNEVVGAFVADKAYPIDYYINKFAYDSGFVIGLNEVADLSRTLSWDGESTVTERLNSVATQFDCELSYSFDIEKFKIKAKYINIHKKRGKDIGDTVHLNKSVDKIVTTKSIANLATALRVTGGTPEPEEPAEGEEYVEPTQITLDGYKYDDGDIFLEGTYLKSRKAAEVWSRYLAEAGDYTGHICKPFNYDTVSQEELCNRAIAELKKIREVEVNYEIDITKLPATAKLGDRINVVDDDGELYLSARILKLEVSETDGTKKAVIGEYLIKNDGISQTVYNLSQRFAVIAQENIKALNAAKAAQKEAESAKQIATNAESVANSAKSAAEISKEAAEMAEQAAANAEVKATEAHDASLEAQRQATIAEQAAGTATEKAESALSNSTEAQTVAGQAKEEAKTAKDTADAAKLDAEQAEKDIAALGEELTTMSNTMTAEYTRKTELTEAKASLQSQIDQNAAQIQSTVTKVTEIDETANNAAEQASQAQSTAAAAQEEANQATADAQAAQQAATAANNAATTAQQEANNAKTAAAEAQSIADKADADLVAAKAELAAVKGRVDATEEDIAAAQKSVNDAQAAADKAKADAATAQSKADAADANAAKAQTAADNAKTAADTAQAAANEAQQAADTAQAAVDALAVRVSKTETDIQQTSERITLLATKEEVTQTLGGYYTKEQTESRIEETAEEINLSVSAVREEVDNINIGGRNLLLGTRDFNVTNNRWTGWINPSSFAIEEYDEGFCVASISASGLSEPGYKSCYSNVVKAETGDAFTISCWFKVDDVSALDFQKVYIFETFTEDGNRVAWDDCSLDRALTGELVNGKWVRLVSQHTVSYEGENLNCGLRLCLFQNGSIHFKKCKMELGNKPTDWTPAPEDMATVEEMNAAIMVKADEITSTVAKNYITATANTTNRQFAMSTSPDTVASSSVFVEKTKASTDRMRGCTYGNGVFVTVGLNGAIQYSEDGGNTWALANSPTAGVIVPVAYGKGVFVAGVSGTNEVINSLDGKTWSVVNTFDDGYPSGIVYANGRFVAIGENFLAYSNDGKTFQRVDLSIPGDYSDVSYGDGKYIAASTTGQIITSINGIDWKDVSIAGDTTHYRAAGYSEAAGRFVVGGAGGVIRYSDDAENWNTATTNSTSTISYIRAFTYCEGVLYACMYTSNGGGEIWTSKDAATWTVSYTSTGRIWCICNGDDKILASGETGRVYLLDLGIEWLNEEPNPVSGEYLWERNVIGMSDGSSIYSDPVLSIDTQRIIDAETAISQNADAIELRATKKEVTNAVNAVDVGGRNLIAETTLDTVYSGNKGSSTYKDVWSEVTIGIPEGTEYIVSFDAKADEAQTIKCFFYNPNTTLTSESSTGQKRENVADGTSQVNITTEWKRYWVKWTQTPATARKAIIVGRCESASTVYIRAVKLEEGNKPTSWTPAPEDYMTATQTKAAIKVEADKISSVVETTNGHETRLSAVEQTANGLTISLNQTNENVATAQSTADNAATAASNAQNTANTANSTANTAKNNAATAQNTANSAASAASTAQTTANNAASAAATAQSTANTANTNATNAAKTATNFLEYTSSGLMIGNKTSGSWSGCRTQITSSAFNILNSSGNQLASFSYNSSEGFTQLTSPTGVLITNGMLARYSGTSGSSSLQSIVSVSSNQATLRATTYNSGGSISANAYLILSSGGADLYGTSSIRITAPTIALEGDVGVEGSIDAIDTITIDPSSTDFKPFISRRKISSTTYRADFGVGNPTTGNAAAMLRLTNSAGSTVHNLFYLHSSNASILYGSFQAGSDRRLKTEISYDFSKLNAVFDNLKPASYKLVKDEQGLWRIGFIAQDVQDAFTAAGYDPEKFGIVSRQGEYLTLAYDEVIPILVAKMQSMAAEIEELKGMKTA